MNTPVGWANKKLGDLAMVERGKFSARPRNDPQYYGGNIAFVQTGDVSSSGKYLRVHSQSLNEKGLSVSRLFPVGTILITIAANIGDSTIATYEVAFPDSVVGIKANPEFCNNEWLYYFLQTCKKRLDQRATQNAQKNINLEVLKPLKILAPPLPEQQKIAAILSTWDRAIAVTEKLIENARSQKKALMQQLLTGKKRLSGFDDQWEKRKVRDLVEIVYGTSPKDIKVTDGKYPVIGTSGEVSRSNDTVYNKMSIVIGRKGTIDKPFLVKEPFWAIDTTYFCKPRACDLVWLFYVLSAINLKKYDESSGVPSLSRDTLYSITIETPEAKEQKEIACIMETCDRQIKFFNNRLNILKQEKSALMQQLLTGKRRVKLPEFTTV